MPVWWRYQDIVNVVGEERATALERDLLRGISNGAISVSADIVIYSTRTQMIKEEMVVLPSAIFRERRALLVGNKKAKFRPEIGKYSNPRSIPPEDHLSSPFEDWSIDCFGLSYRGAELIKELGLLVPSATVVRAVLPENAKPNDHKHAEFAHKAAEMLRADRSIKPESAFMQVAPTDLYREPRSVIRAIRKSFEMMYKPDGTPHQN